MEIVKRLDLIEFEPLILDWAHIAVQETKPVSSNILIYMFYSVAIRQNMSINTEITSNIQ